MAKALCARLSASALRQHCPRLQRQVNAIHHWHYDIGKDDVRLHLFSPSQSCRAIGDADCFKTFVTEDFENGVADKGLIRSSFFSGNVNSDHLVNSAQAHGLDFEVFAKPIRPERLIAMLRSGLQRASGE